MFYVYKLCGTKELRRILNSEMSENRELKQHGHESKYSLIVYLYLLTMPKLYIVIVFVNVCI